MAAPARRASASPLQHEAARDQLDQTRNTAVKQVTDAYDAMETGLAEHDAATSLQDAARFRLDSALDAYAHGVGTYTDSSAAKPH